MKKFAIGRKKWWLLLLVPVALLVGVFGWHVYRRAAASEYKTFWSPDSNYRVVVYRMPELYAMPGASGDAPGYVRLYDKAGRILKEQDVEMVQLIDRVRWENGKVTIALFAEWDLPH
jgi:hypothetical protein